MTDELTEAGGRTRLYVTGDLGEGVALPLDEGQAHYLLHVLRAKSGNLVSLFNGRDGEWLAELAAGSELVLIDGTVTEIPRPALASTRRLFWNVKHACSSYQSLTVVTPAGDFLALTSGWPGKVHELEALDHAAFLPALVTSKVL